MCLLQAVCILSQILQSIAEGTAHVLQRGRREVVALERSAGWSTEGRLTSVRVNDAKLFEHYNAATRLLRFANDK